MGSRLDLKKSMRYNKLGCEFPFCEEKSIGEYKLKAICKEHLELVTDLHFLGILKEEPEK